MVIQPKTPANESKTRVQLDLAPAQISRLNALMEMCELETRKDLFNNALTLFSWAIDEICAGKNVGSSGKDGFARLQMPAFVAAQGYARQRQEAL